MSNHEIFWAGSDHAVLLIHGLTGSPFELKHLARRLHKAGFSVRAICLAGHGSTIEHLKLTRWEDWYGTIIDTFREMKKKYQTVSVAGLCMGALLALYLASEVGHELAAISLMSTTIFYDGWSLPWYKFLLPLSYLPPFCYFYSYEEREPYGIKNESVRRHVAALLRDNDIAYSTFPSQSMHELFKLIREVKKSLPRVNVPTLILHALEDDLASIRSADYVEEHITSRVVRKVFLEDTYHMLTLDNQKEAVAKETVDFFRNHSGLYHPLLKNEHFSLTGSA
jgi:carboxylesterase